MGQNRIKRQQMELLSGIMGCMMLLLFGRLLEDNGMAYLGLAYLTVGVVQTMLCGGVEEGLGKILKTRKEKGQYRNVEVTRRRILIWQGCLSFLATILLLIGAGFFAEHIFQIHYSTVLIRILAVSLFFRGVTSVMLGCFLGEEKEGLATLIPLVRQFLVLVFGLFFANRLGDYGAKVSGLLGNDAYMAMYAGMGIAVAVSLTELLLFLFVCFQFMRRKRMYKGDGEEGMRQVDSLFGTFRSFYGGVWMPMLFKLFPVLILWMGMFFYHQNEGDGVVFAEYFGILCGKFLPLCGIPFLVICILLRIIYLRKSRIAGKSYQKGLRMAVVSALFFTMYLAVMSGQLAGMFGGNGSKVLGEMFGYGSSLILVGIVFFYLSHLLILYEKRKVLPPVYGLMTIVYVIAASLGLRGDEAQIMVLICAGMIAVAIGDILLGLLCSRLLHVHVDWLRTVAIPIGIVAVVGLLCMLLGKIFTPHLGDFVTALVNLVISGILYWLLYKKTSFY